MQQKILLAGIVAMVFLLVFSVIRSSTFQSAFGEVGLTKATPLTISGERILTVGIGQQAILQVDIENKNDEVQPFVVIIEIRDADDVTTYLQFQKGMLQPELTTQIGISWTPESTGNFKVRSFALSDFENPTIISPSTVSSVEVGSITELDFTINNSQEEPPVLEPPKPP